MTLQEKIEANRRRETRRDRAERVLRQVRLKVFDYEDNGQYEKAARVIALCKRILKPRWEAQAASAKARRDERLLFLTE